MKKSSILTRNFIFSLMLALLIKGAPSAAGNYEEILTKEERDYLKKHRGQITLGADPDYAPVEFVDENGKFAGAATDYLSLLEEKINFKFRRVFFETWQELMNAARRGEVDIVQALNITEERKKLFLFTDPYIISKNVILTSKPVHGNFSISDLKGKRVSFVADYSIDFFLRQKYKELVFDPIPDIKAGLQKLAFKSTDALITDMAVATYYIEQKGFTNIYLAGDTEFTYYLRIGSQINNPILNSILKKGLNAITEAERKSIDKKWYLLKSDLIFMDKPFFFITLIIAGIVLITAALMIIWNRMLKKQVSIRTRELKDSQQELERRVEMRTQELKNKNNELQQLITEKNSFLSIISHDLKNPFLSILGFSEILDKEYDTISDQDRRTYFQEIRTKVHRLYEMMNNLLLWTHSQMNGFKLEMEDFSIMELVTETMQLLSTAASQKNIALLCEGSEVIRVCADKNTVSTVVRNLLSNAIKFTKNGGSIKISARENMSFCTVSVMDTGVGMNNEQLDSLFKPHIKSSTRGTENEQGSGLGLILCKEFVEKNGGRIWAESTPEAGSAFHFTLPKIKTGGG